MEGPASVLVISVVVIAILRCTWRLVNWAWIRPRKLETILSQQGVKGKPYRLLVGDALEEIIMLKEANSKPITLSHDITPRVQPLFYHRLMQYGKNCILWYGPTPWVAIMNPEHIREIFTRIYDFEKPKINPVFEVLVSGLERFNGEEWSHHRKILNPTFRFDKIKLLIPAISESCREMIEKWEKLLMTREDGARELDVWPDLETLASDLVSRSVIGCSYGVGQRLFQLIKEHTQLAMKVLPFATIPGWRFLPTKVNRRSNKIHKEVKASLSNIINQKLKAIEAGKTRNMKDLLSILLESNFKLIEDGQMSIDYLIEQCKQFYFAGADTTSELLAWTMVLLSIHPQWQTRAREEVMQAFGKNQPDFDGLNHLKVVTMILNEVLRLYPPALMLVRGVSKDVKLGDLSLPAGAWVIMPALFIHRDKEHWGDDANEFRPDRFADGISKATDGQITFFPFSWGPRTCLGQNVAMIKAKMALAMILQHFTFELSPSYIHAPTFIITLKPQHGAHLILRKI